ncbi:hypothetical protein WMY93_010371 [Mugilogobius chulae]|uniref:MADF domain-containing protein n=1 Tax=Mugilogobius chulae TaxID=88201 RepID=A0AAW0P701_9GOBI
MAETLINLVSTFPELYDTTSRFYRDRNKKDLAWRRISERVGQPEVWCRAKWKGLRDTYLKEKRKEKKRSGAAGGTRRKWRYYAIMTFLDDHIEPRATSGNMAHVEEAAAQYPPTPDRGEEEAESSGSESQAAQLRPEDSAAAQSPPRSPVPGPSSRGPALSAPRRRRSTAVRHQEEPSEVEETILNALRQPPPQPVRQFTAVEHYC